MERLSRMAQALRPCGAAATPPPLPHARLLRQNDDGSVLPEDLAMLRREEEEAVAARDYRRAALLAATEEALRPKPRLTAEECSPTGVEAQHAFFLEHGFVFLRDVLPPEMLPRAQAAWTAAEERAQAEWEAKMAAGADGLTQQDQRFFDLPNLLSEDDVFIDMVDSPALVPVLSRLTGSEQALNPDSTIRAAG